MTLIQRRTGNATTLRVVDASGTTGPHPGLRASRRQGSKRLSSGRSDVRDTPSPSALVDRAGHRSWHRFDAEDSRGGRTSPHRPVAGRNSAKLDHCPAPGARRRQRCLSGHRPASRIAPTPRPPHPATLPAPRCRPTLQGRPPRDAAYPYRPPPRIAATPRRRPPRRADHPAGPTTEEGRHLASPVCDAVPAASGDGALLPLITAVRVVVAVVAAGAALAANAVRFSGWPGFGCRSSRARSRPESLMVLVRLDAYQRRG